MNNGMYFDKTDNETERESIGKTIECEGTDIAIECERSDRKDDD